MAKNDKREKNESIDIPRFSKSNLKSADEVSEFTENIINTVRKPLIVLDNELIIITTSSSWHTGKWN